MAKHRQATEISVNAYRDWHRKQSRYWRNRWRWFLYPRLVRKVNKLRRRLLDWWYN